MTTKFNEGSDPASLMTENNAVQPPTAFPEPGVYHAPHIITLLCATPNGEIHYTLDGSQPTMSSPLFDPYRLIPLEEFGQEVTEGKRTSTIRAVAQVGDQVSDVKHSSTTLNHVGGTNISHKNWFPE